MTSRGNLPNHLLVAARTGVLVPAERVTSMPWRRIALPVNLTAKSTTLVDIGGMPLPTKQPQVVQDMIEKARDISPEDWYISVSISQNLIDDDQTGQILSKFRGVGGSFMKYLNTRVFQALNAGDGSTISTCYDGSDLFDDDHIDDGADYQTAQDNEYALALTPDNFKTVWVAANQTKDDKGNYNEYVYDLLVTNPSLITEASNITNNEWEFGSGDRTRNPFDGRLSYMTNPNLDTNAWHLIASSETTKPIIVGIRKAPTLIGLKFDAQEEDGGAHIFTYHARDVVVYGDWRLAYQGNT